MTIHQHQVSGTSQYCRNLKFWYQLYSTTANASASVTRLHTSDTTVYCCETHHYIIFVCVWEESNRHPVNLTNQRTLRRRPVPVKRRNYSELWIGQPGRSPSSGAKTPWRGVQVQGFLLVRSGATLLEYLIPQCSQLQELTSETLSTRSGRTPSTSMLTNKDTFDLLKGISRSNNLQKSKDGIFLSEDQCPENLDPIFAKADLATDLNHTLDLLRWNKKTDKALLQFTVCDRMASAQHNTRATLQLTSATDNPW